MRYIFLVFVLLIGISLADVRWLSLKEGLKKAKKERKMILIYITSKHCQYCKKMDRTTFKRKSIQEYINRYFIPIKVEKDSYEGKKVKNMYGYVGTPTFHFLEPDGKKVKTLFGAWKPEEFLGILKYFAEGHYKHVNMTEYFMKN